ncbi:superoxide dismutase family protein [Aldersonia sp. NBC_00410]|uniref:superoxide dismutase[Cu-Zn] n=1 Tax=Aldersonia sp. NBC_00410 TaxID=2975954 RepID=UPI00225A4859|nr:superoxide dismutase family protein [Aldersonia sp. NBC_00410]MCX5041930.1 superoxide dismutase family protein [Aldersonia sp. NBC_00410]
MVSPARSRVRRNTVRLAAPIVAVAALGLVACSNSQEPSDVAGTTPPVWTGSPAPGASGTEGAAAGSDQAASSVESELKDPSGRSVGTVTFTKDGDYLEIKVEASGLQPGFHGLHVHEFGKCEPNSVAPTGGAPGNFLSAGGHLQVQGHTGHPSSGDLTSLQVRGDGTGSLVTTTDAFTLDDLTSGEGHAVIVHANADNFANIPTRYALPDNAPVPDQTTLSTGDAGGRVACGVIK